MENLGSPLPNFFQLLVEKTPKKIQRGLYLVYYFHDGVRMQSKFYIINVSGYSHTNENYFVKAKSLIPDTDYYIHAIEYNSATCEVKIVDDAPQNIVYTFVKLL